AREFMPLVGEATSRVARCDLLDGHFDLAVRGFEDAMEIDRGMRDWGAQTANRMRLGQAHLWAGSTEVARPLLADAYERARENGDELIATEALVHLGAA